jgi:hypothetical protein
VAKIFKSAVAYRVIASSPWIAITLPKRADAEIVPLNVSKESHAHGVLSDCRRAHFHRVAPEVDEWGAARATGVFSA